MGEFWVGASLDGVFDNVGSVHYVRGYFDLSVSRFSCPSF
jgi:hypothetical protein